MILASLFATALAGPLPLPSGPVPLPSLVGAPSVGLTQLGSVGVGQDGHRFGLSLSTRRSTRLSDHFSVNLVGSAGITQPRRTLAVASFAVDAGRWSVNGFRDVSGWVREGEGRHDHGLRSVAATAAYAGLGATFVSVPVLLALSPLAAVGHVVVGPTISFQTGSEVPNLLIEVGVGGTLYGDPVGRLPALGVGPMFGVGTEVQGHLIAVQMLISPSGLHLNGRDTPDTLVTSQVVVGF